MFSYEFYQNKKHVDDMGMSSQQYDFNPKCNQYGDSQTCPKGTKFFQCRTLFAMPCLFCNGVSIKKPN